MALQKLVSGATEIEFNPLVNSGYIETNMQEIPRWRSTSNKLFSYQFGNNKWHYEIPVLVTAKASADQINSWAKSNTELTFYYDLENEATETRTVHIINEGDPLQMTVPTWENRYEGMIILEEV
tara:strand:- start:24 stop:395 length:372 start_codon:yes stop_codon:yes gene_type:complete